MPTFIPRNPEREAKYAEWKDRCARKPGEYRIIIRNHGDCMIAHLMRKADDQWYSIDELPRWNYKYEDFYDA